jgi:hypothetical protein
MKKLLTTIAAIAAIALSAQAERAVIYGTLTIISDQFVVKTFQPFETEIEGENGGGCSLFREQNSTCRIRAGRSSFVKSASRQKGPDGW